MFLLEQDNVLQLADFHCHWHLIRKDTPRLLLEPRPRIDAVATTSPLPMSSLRRELSGFELVEASVATRTAPLCSKCHVLGHAKTSKECPLQYIELKSLQTTTQEGPSVPAQTTSFSGQPHSLPANIFQQQEQGPGELPDGAYSEGVSASQQPTEQPTARSETSLQAEKCHSPPPNQHSAEIVQEPLIPSVDRVARPTNVPLWPVRSSTMIREPYISGT